MEIYVVEFRAIANGGRLKAFASVKVGYLTIHDWRIVKENGQRAWVSVPQCSWQDKDEKIKYRALLSIPGELKQRIEVAILSAWEKENYEADL